ncbi:hypothetical protein [Bradyrhizobium uaiense]|uniref:Uncharacterized protein n=1 Tax=Bradyrhizobium uaiense TaxID=2594946 RepID=A0A6P1BS53_9BRAD|nr:hypothetical protein [Bradyrhizobium uaiense]NEV00990.1 hypothetical protein [Bradyrhizobium uaiense]
MTTVYVEIAKLTFTISDGKIECIEKGRSGFPDIKADMLDATFDAIHIAGDRLYLDWLALTDLAAFLYREHPQMRWKRFTRKLLDYFPGSIHIKDLMRATLRCIAEREHFAQGDGLHFIGRVRSTHIDEMRMIKTTFVKQYGHLLVTYSDAERASL